MTLSCFNSQNKCFYHYMLIKPLLFSSPGDAERQREEHVDQEAMEVKGLFFSCIECSHTCIFSCFCLWFGL